MSLSFNITKVIGSLPVLPGFGVLHKTEIIYFTVTNLKCFLDSASTY